MSHRFIADLRAGDRIEDDVFLIRSKDLRTTTQGSFYIHAVLIDRTGQLVARMWQATEEIFDAMPEGGFMCLKGRVENYKGNPQFIIDSVRAAEPGSFEVGDYLPTTERNIDRMWDRLIEIVRGIKHPDLAALVEEFLADEDLMDRFRRAPAAMSMHHAYIGGLLEHTLSLLEMAVLVVPLHPKLSPDLMLAGIFLHDIGKTKELAYDAAISYTDEGQLLGHIVQATVWIGQKADAVAARTGTPFPEQLRWVLQHIVLSHHGRYEFGSPKLPAVPEAIAIHHLDNLDAKVSQFLDEIEDDRDPKSNWTSYNRALETKVYKPNLMDLKERRTAKSE